MHTRAPLPTSDVDLFADDVLRDPYPALRELRYAGPAVRLTVTRLSQDHHGSLIRWVSLPA
jgi:hypothetical protein